MELGNDEPSRTCVLDSERIGMTFKAIEDQSHRLQDPLRDRSVEAQPALRSTFVIVALDVRRALVDRLHEQARARVPAVLRALVVVAALEPPAPAAVHAVLHTATKRRQHAHQKGFERGRKKGAHPVVGAVVLEAGVEGALVGRAERVELAHDGRVGGDLADGEGGEREECGGELHDVCG